MYSYLTVVKFPTYSVKISRNEYSCPRWIGTKAYWLRLIFVEEATTVCKVSVDCSRELYTRSHMCLYMICFCCPFLRFLHLPRFHRHNRYIWHRKRRSQLLFDASCVIYSELTPRARAKNRERAVLFRWYYGWYLGYQGRVEELMDWSRWYLRCAKWYSTRTPTSVRR